ncbi:anti-repressor protein [Salibacterium salarium]|uniref:phage antirepressor KilAC domain-containing protein n=1 Tax=Salibacterium salarium TaxID=284579 RepID=UPI0027882712|nr:phage antirepressor KilAC domain-containing protein [Salibacterium salarium]MDQ0299685.1 anti-repressor protein [Salibacterium salarium]
MTDIKIFNHNLFGELRVTSIDEKEHFNLMNVAWSLGYTRESKGTHYLRYDRINNVIKKLDITTVDHDGQLFIDESGLYDFIFEAGTEKARDFRKWVTAEVLPSIRKHGAYMTPEKIEETLMNPDTIIKLATNLKEEQEKRQAVEHQLRLDKPYSTFGKAISKSNASINVGAFAKMMYDDHGIKLGRNKMFAWLRDNGYLIKNGRERNNPKQKYIEQGLFDTSVTLVSRTEGDVENVTTLITGKGQVKFADILINEFLEVI